MKTDSEGRGPEAYLVVEDPEKVSSWHLPVKDAGGKLNHTLMGAAHAALTVGYRGNTYDGPKKAEALAKLKVYYKSEGMEWPEDAKMAAFSSELDAAIETDEDGYVVRYGKLFEVGDYPDKGFSLDREEMTQAIAEFEPVDLDVCGDAHIPTMLRGKIGRVSQVAASPDGTTLFGKVHIPPWLDSLLEGTGRKVSTEWDRTTKRLNGLALVRNPRVTDAALMAAFAAGDQYREGGQYARHNTSTGQSHIQTIHDQAVQAGAVCSPVGMASKHESSAIQQVHDVAASHGARCEPPSPGINPGINAPALPPAFSTTDNNRSTRMKIKEFLTGKAKEEGVELDDIDNLDPSDPNPTSGFSDTEAQKKLEAEVARLSTERDAMLKVQEAQTAAFAKIEAEKRHVDAASFARSKVDGHRITPAAAETLTALMERISASDATATFAEGEKSTATLLTEFVEALPDLSVFTTSQIKNEDVAALFNQLTTPDPNNPTGPNQATVDKMLAATPDGREILAARANSNGKN